MSTPVLRGVIDFYVLQYSLVRVTLYSDELQYSGILLKSDWTMTTELTTPTDDNDADGWFFPMDKEKYHPYIASLMGFIHGQQYTNTKTFTREEMTAVTPVHVRNWMCMKAFRKTAITSTDRPKYCRGNTLAQMKKFYEYNYYCLAYDVCYAMLQCKDLPWFVVGLLRYCTSEY